MSSLENLFGPIWGLILLVEQGISNLVRQPDALLAISVLAFLWGISRSLHNISDRADNLQYIKDHIKPLEDGLKDVVDKIMHVEDQIVFIIKDIQSSVDKIEYANQLNVDTIKYEIQSSVHKIQYEIQKLPYEIQKFSRKDRLPDPERLVGNNLFTAQQERHAEFVPSPKSEPIWGPDKPWKTKESYENAVQVAMLEKQRRLAQPS